LFLVYSPAVAGTDTLSLINGRPRFTFFKARVPSFFRRGGWYPVEIFNPFRPPTPFLCSPSKYPSFSPGRRVPPFNPPFFVSLFQVFPFPPTAISVPSHPVLPRCFRQPPVHSPTPPLLRTSLALPSLFFFPYPWPLRCSAVALKVTPPPFPKFSAPTALSFTASSAQLPSHKGSHGGKGLGNNPFFRPVS